MGDIYPWIKSAAICDLMSFLMDLHMEYPTLVRQTIINIEGEKMTPELEPAQSTFENQHLSRYSNKLGFKLKFLKLSNFPNGRP